MPVLPKDVPLHDMDEHFIFNEELLLSDLFGGFMDLISFGLLWSGVRVEIEVPCQLFLNQVLVPFIRTIKQAMVLCCDSSKS